MRVKTFYDESLEEGVILTPEEEPRPTKAPNLVKVLLDNGKTVVRHKSRITALDEAAREFLA